jgi:hypothetical protein
MSSLLRRLPSLQTALDYEACPRIAPIDASPTARVYFSYGKLTKPNVFRSEAASVGRERRVKMDMDKYIGLPLSEQLRRAIRDSEMSCYQICRIIKLSQGTMSRFMNKGGGLSMSTIDELADLLHLDLSFNPMVEELTPEEFDRRERKRLRQSR